MVKPPYDVCLPPGPTDLGGIILYSLHKIILTPDKAVARKLAEIVYAIAVSGEEWSLEKAMEGIRRGEEMAMRRMEMAGVERRAERPTESSEIDINIF